MAPFPHPAHRTGHADLPHPALGQELTISRATPSAVSDHLSELIGFPISKVLQRAKNSLPNATNLSEKKSKPSRQRRRHRGKFSATSGAAAPFGRDAGWSTRLQGGGTQVTAPKSANDPEAIRPLSDLHRRRLRIATAQTSRLVKAACPRRRGDRITMLFAGGA